MQDLKESIFKFQNREVEKTRGGKEKEENRYYSNKVRCPFCPDLSSHVSIFSEKFLYDIFHLLSRKGNFKIISFWGPRNPLTQGSTNFLF